MPACAEAAPALRLADVFARSVPDLLRQHRFTDGQARALRRAAVCRTPALGGHQVVCTRCGHAEARYHSCRDRHCPTCRALPQAKWIAQREQRLLPTGHFHVVFTMPAQLRPMASCHPRRLYELLFQSAADVLKTLGREVLGGRLGITMVLHTWTRKLLLHPHVHCIVSAGALSPDGTVWTPSRRGWLFPIRRMAAMFRTGVLRRVTAAMDEGGLEPPRGATRTALLRRLHRMKWVVFAKRPFGRAEHLVRYLGRYTHRVAISDRRVVRIDEGGLVFRTRDGQVCALDDARFLKRFAQHVLPRGFRKIRHYGLYAPSSVRRLLPAAAALLSPGKDEDASVEREPMEPMDMLTLLTGPPTRPSSMAPSQLLSTESHCSPHEAMAPPGQGSWNTMFGCTSMVKSEYTGGPTQ